MPTFAKLSRRSSNSPDNSTLVEKTVSNGLPLSIGRTATSRFQHDFSTIPVHSPPSSALATNVSQDEPRLTLEQLWSAVASSPTGQKLLSKVAKAPKVKWGATAGGFHGEWTGKNIILNESEKEILSDGEWKQVIAMELGNAANDAIFQTIFTEADANPPSRDDFIDSIEKVEFETRLAVVAAYKGGEFCEPSAKDCKPLFDISVTDFESYRKDPRGKAHRESYGGLWDEDYRDKYNKVRPEGK